MQNDDDKSCRQPAMLSQSLLPTKSSLGIGKLWILLKAENTASQMAEDVFTHGEHGHYAVAILNIITMQGPPSQ